MIKHASNLVVYWLIAIGILFVATYNTAPTNPRYPVEAVDAR